MVRANSKGVFVHLLNAAGCVVRPDDTGVRQRNEPIQHGARDGRDAARQIERGRLGRLACVKPPLPLASVKAVIQQAGTLRGCGNVAGERPGALPQFVGFQLPKTKWLLR